MKKLFVFTDQYPYGTGESFFETELSYLEKRFSVTIITMAAKSDIYRKVSPETQIISYQDQKSPRIVIQSLFLALKNLRREKLSFVDLSRRKDAIHFFGWSYRFMTFLKQKKLLIDDAIYYTYWHKQQTLALVLAKKYLNWKPCRIVSRIHGHDLYKERTKNNYQPFKRSLLQDIDALYFISRAGEVYYEENYGSKPKHEVQYLGVRTTYDAQSFHLSKSHTIVTCSALIPLKRVDIIIDALSLLKTPIHWVHFGTGPLQNCLQEQAEKKLVENKRITYQFMGQVKNDKIHEFYRNNQVDLFINTSSSEGVPISILEALSYGIPSLATDVGGSKEALLNQNFLLPADVTPEELAKRMEAFFLLPFEQQFQYRKAATNLWKSRFNSEIQFTKFALLLAGGTEQINKL
uniref:glycosyltransferase n=1 Tax=Ndongobacter massiliensis TaxID=1871025 RepID=UPI000930B7A1|nr:glycosyltransferase [Ndongobacter massiliensis]